MPQQRLYEDHAARQRAYRARKADQRQRTPQRPPTPKEHQPVDTLWEILDRRLGTVRPKLPSARSKAPEATDLALVFPLTDAHAGARTRAEDAGKRFATDLVEFGQRFTRWETELRDFILRMQRLGTVVAISIPSLGDVIENALMRPGASDDTEANNVESVLLFADCLTSMVTRLAEAHPGLRIDLEFLDGNHDRITEHKGSRPRAESWSGVAYGIVVRVLRHLTNVRVYRHTEPSVLVEVLGEPILLTHGDTIGSGNHKSVETAIDSFLAFHRVRFTTAIMGHFHHRATWTTNSGVHVVMCPAFADSNPFAADHNLVNRGMQKALVFERSKGLTFEYPLYLSDPIPASPVHTR